MIGPYLNKIFQKLKNSIEVASRQKKEVSTTPLNASRISKMGPEFPNCTQISELYREF